MRFCTECGGALAAVAPAPLARACPRCHAPVGAGLAFCTECGLALPAPGATPHASAPGLGRPPPACATCGERLPPGLRFCTSCGTPVGGAAAAAAPPPVPMYAAPTTAAHPSMPPSVPGRSRVWPWVAAAVVLLAGVVGGGYVLLTRDDDGSSEVASDDGLSIEEDDGDDDAAADVTDPAEPSGEESEGAGATAPATTDPAPAAAVTCWDGSLASSAGACSRPQGLAGLAYVFPSMADQGCATESGSAPGRKILMQCTGYLADGTAITINYSQWASVSAAMDHYLGKGLIQTLTANGINTFTGYTSTGVLNNAWIYEKEPYSASVYAPNRAAMTEALALLVVGRLATEVRGGAS